LLVLALLIAGDIAQRALGEEGEPGARVGAGAPRSQKAKPDPYECRFAQGEIKIDGLADEADWKLAQAIDNFALPWLRDKARPPRSATTARLLWDREHLYFFAEMDDTDLYADIQEHDGRLWLNDVFELFFKPAADKPGYYEFQVSPAGTVLDLFIPQRGAGIYERFKADGEFHIQAAVKLRGTLNQWADRDSGWSVEGRIPWTDWLRTGGRPAVGETWAFALCRYDYSVDFEGPELSTSAPLQSREQPDFHHYEDYAPLRFAGPTSRAARAAGRPLGIERLPPLTTSRVIGSPDPPLPYRVARAYGRLRLDFPIAVANEPGSERLWIIAQSKSYGPTAIYRMIDSPEAEKLELVKTEEAAYGICFHPDFLKNGYVFVGSNGAYDGGPKKTRVTRYTVGRQPPFALDLDSAKVILEWESDGHNGGDLAFGLDGRLYITSGDGTSDSDTNLAGQDMTRLLAKVLRIDVDHPAEGRAYSVPKDNPFVGMPGVRPETWAYGLRNPWRITVDRQTGHIWVGNNGQDLWEQIFFVRRGDNYGWSVMEGSHPFYPNRQAGPTPFVKPALEHPHSEARSLTGGLVYYGQKLPELRGAYLYGDYSTGKIWAARHDGTQVTWHKELADTTLQITGFGTDSQGEILIADHRGQGEGAFYRLEPAPPHATRPEFPRKLSETGLFRSVPGHVVEPALIPYSVNSPLWSDGAHKERWIAIPHKPGQDMRIEMTTSRGWGFPNETVLVKSFALEMEQGNAASRKWIETRLLTRQENEWVGYSYLWNDEQTEATLVDAAGADREFQIRVPRDREHPDGLRRQVWRFPSRTECLVCHSRAANWVLGLTTLQMNKMHDYGGIQDNQLRVLEHLGLLKVNWHAEAIALLRDQAKQDGLSERRIEDFVRRQTATRSQREPPQSSLLAQSPDRYPRLVDPYDKQADLNLRARSYLHANCSQCHVEAGGGNAQIDLEFTTPLAKMKLLDVKPQHHTFGLPDPRLVVPGSPERSVMLHRVANRGSGQMPQLATSLVDEAAVELLRAWIASLKDEAQGVSSQ
jgi:uncharacterized repeat protein (TIGR03806 family)